MPAAHQAEQLVASADAVTVEDLAVSSDTPGIALHLRHEWVPALGPFTAERTVVLVHGATYASGSLFDVRLSGLSFLDHLALAGLDVFALDVRGYGGSTRPRREADGFDGRPNLLAAGPEAVMNPGGRLS